MIDQITSTDSARSVRRSCRVLGFRRQTYYDRRRGNRPEEREAAIIELLERTCSRFVAWGFWMIFHYLRNQELITDNHKRVYRLWKQAGLNLRLPPQRPRIRRDYQALLSPDQVNQGWAMDFVSDWVVGPDKQAVRVINIMDECSRRALWTEAHRSIHSTKLIKVLDQVIEMRGVPKYIRCDNGPEFISNKLRVWADRHSIDLKFIQPGKPNQNGLIERLNRTLRVECLNLNWFTSLEELNNDIDQWMVTYNRQRPHQNLSYKAPVDYENSKDNFYFRVVAA